MEFERVNQILGYFTLPLLTSNLDNLEIIIKQVRNQISLVEKEYALHYKTIGENKEIKSKNETYMLSLLLNHLI